MPVFHDKIYGGYEIDKTRSIFSIQKREYQGENG